jgi:hypothetical protein
MHNHFQFEYDLFLFSIDPKLKIHAILSIHQNLIELLNQHMQLMV